MDYSKVIKHGYELFVNNTFKKEDIKNFLLKHENLPKMITNLSRELKSADKIIRVSCDSSEYKRNLVDGLIRDFSKTFCKAALLDIENKRGFKNEKTN